MEGRSDGEVENDVRGLFGDQNALAHVQNTFFIGKDEFSYAVEGDASIDLHNAILRVDDQIRLLQHNRRG